MRFGVLGELPWCLGHPRMHLVECWEVVEEGLRCIG